MSVKYAFIRSEEVRHDRVSTAGTITLRHDGTLYRIGIGKTYARTYVLALVQDLDIRIINAAIGEILRDLTLDPTRIYQGTGPGLRQSHDWRSVLTGRLRSLA